MYICSLTKQARSDVPTPGRIRLTIKMSMACHRKSLPRTGTVVCRVKRRRYRLKLKFRVRFYLAASSALSFGNASFPKNDTGVVVISVSNGPFVVPIASS